MKYAIASLLFSGYASRILLVLERVKGVAVEYNSFARTDPIALGIRLAVVVRERHASSFPPNEHSVNAGNIVNVSAKTTYRIVATGLFLGREKSP
ncbi:MAG: hypothetical protein WCC21_19130 [Candidatus Acidiferrales bacterium]